MLEVGKKYKKSRQDLKSNKATKSISRTARPFINIMP